MAKVLLLQFNTDPACSQRRALLEESGCSVAVAEPLWPVFFDTVNAQRPDLIVIAASRILSHAIEAARYLGEGFNTRDIPVYLVDVDPKDIKRVKDSAPQAKLISRDQLAALPTSKSSLP